jgi:multiple sugar transport system substrate-binding protein/putative aldouronate transport system substrate-binding protein
MAKIRKFLMCIALVLAACSRPDGGKQDSGAVAGGWELYQIDVFHDFANYMGISPGWWAKILKDELNMELNIVAPIVAGMGDALYQTRSAAGNLGDLIVVNNARALDLHAAGLLMDIKPLLDSGNYPYLQDKPRVAYEKFAEKFDGRGIYAIPGLVSSRSPVVPAGRALDPMTAVFLRFDWYLDIGAPEINGLDGLMDVVEKMVKAHPVDENGDKSYGFSGFPDWDGNTARLAVEMLCLMGFRGGGTDYIWINYDGTKFSYLMDDNGEYKRILKFMNTAYRRGLLDPDSSTQNWDTHADKFRSPGRIAMQIWPFQGNSIFAQIDLSKNAPYAVVPVDGLVVNLDGYNPYGVNSFSFAIGAKAKYPDRIMEFMNWLCSPKGALVFRSQIEGITYEMRDGQPYLTEFGRDADPDKRAPASLGGGIWSEGTQRFADYGMIHDDDPNELLNGYSSAYSLWPSFIEMNKNEWSTKWRELYQADNPLEMLKNRNLLEVTPGTDYTAPTNPSNIQNALTQLRSITQPAGWQMIYAASDAEFEKIWRDMKAQLDDFGYQEVIAWEEKNLADRVAAIQSTLTKYAGK